MPRKDDVDALPVLQAALRGILESSNLCATLTWVDEGRIQNSC